VLRTGGRENKKQISTIFVSVYAVSKSDHLTTLKTPNNEHNSRKINVKHYNSSRNSESSINMDSGF
jgi:Tfp pilus assembly major pilin PilA